MTANGLTLGPLLVNPLRLNQICKADTLMQVARVDGLLSAQEATAYARAFAAAPELAASLIELLASICEQDGEYEDGESSMVDRARAAISKFTGEPA